MLTTRAVGADCWLVVITFILVGCVVIATFAGIVCNTLGNDCADFGVTFNGCSIGVVVTVVTFAFAVVI